MLFDGTDDYGSITRQISANFSIEFWFKSTQGIGTTGEWPQYAGMVDANTSGTNADFGVSLSSTGVVKAGVGTPDVTISSGTGLQRRELAPRRHDPDQSSGLFMLYVDGCPVGRPPAAQPLHRHGEHQLRANPAGTNYYQGNLDEIAIYNTVLSGATVTAHYAAR